MGRRARSSEAQLLNFAAFLIFVHRGLFRCQIVRSQDSAKGLYGLFFATEANELRIENLELRNTQKDFRHQGESDGQS
jgi:hypothetical protein